MLAWCLLINPTSIVLVPGLLDDSPHLFQTVYLILHTYAGRGGHQVLDGKLALTHFILPGG